MAEPVPNVKKRNQRKQNIQRRQRRRREKNKKRKPKTRGLRSKISKAQGPPLEFRKWEGNQ